MKVTKSKSQWQKIGQTLVDEDKSVDHWTLGCWIFGTVSEIVSTPLLDITLDMTWQEAQLVEGVTNGE